MPRPKGPGAIRYLDATQQGDVEMRELLSRGRPPTAEEKELNELCAERGRLKVRLTTLQTWRRVLHEALNAEGDITLPRAQADGRVRRELRNVKTEIGQLEDDLARADKQIERIQNEIGKAPAPAREEFYEWQERALALIAIHKYRDRDGDHVASPQGSTIKTSELQKQLHAEGFKVGARELRRFMRQQCRVAGQQGKRTDLAFPNEKKGTRDAA
jgi:chromosome segregation ATPase